MQLLSRLPGTCGISLRSSVRKHKRAKRIQTTLRSIHRPCTARIVRRRPPKKHKGSNLKGISPLIVQRKAQVVRASDEDKDEVSEAVDKGMSWMGPVLTALGLSGFIGFSSGIAFKFVGLGLAVAFGVFFAFIQVLVTLGIIDIHWEVVEKELDVTGDEKFDQEDVKVASKSIIRFLGQGVPSVGGFIAGFFLGIRMG